MEWVPSISTVLETPTNCNWKSYSQSRQLQEPAYNSYLNSFIDGAGDMVDPILYQKEVAGNASSLVNGPFLLDGPFSSRSQRTLIFW